MMDRHLRWMFQVLATSLISIALLLGTTINYRDGMRPMIDPISVGGGSIMPESHHPDQQRVASANDLGGFVDNSASKEFSPSFSPVSTFSSSLSTLSRDSSHVPRSASHSSSSSSSSPSSSSFVSGDRRGISLDGHLDEPPVLAYFLGGTKGDGNRMKRLLLALYHPHNEYLLHLDRESPAAERLDLARFVTLHPTFIRVGNVRVIVNSNLVTYRGPTMIATTLHGMAILLKETSRWDWFINLSPSDYPLITQDDFLYVLSSVPRDLNFLDHSSVIPDWKEAQRVRPIVVDPAIYRQSKSDLFFTTQRRATPNAFRLFQGSAWMMLSRSFCQYLISGWDNLPRLALMYFANVISSPESYFHTVICNSREYFNTTVNSDLHYIAWDNPPKQHPLSLNSTFYEAMINSSAPFARKFEENEPVLDAIDAQQLRGRKEGQFVEGGWCGGGKGVRPRVERRGDDGGREGGGAAGGGKDGGPRASERSSDSFAARRWRRGNDFDMAATGVEGEEGEGGGGGEVADPCLAVGDPTALQPGAGGVRLEKLILELLGPQVFRQRQCV
ncbi:hypothetical protein CBR_g29812 [Chara braunii]|uniref:GT14-family glycosyltransferase n=1 Tax=Chara braunii TaxID=69332 RepID=A0A388LBJ8_CHABU|nr:hypothetical protein CBR_g29812 [Chara braunii]|eukprot:GBG79664.1 hypothetical protein CBR_g29812 [Chara braunii]